MSGASLQGALESVLPPGSLRNAESGYAAQGATLDIRPPDGSAVAAAVRVLNEHGATALVRGQGTSDALGNRMGAVDVVLSTCGLEGVDELDLQDGVVHVGAGTKLAALRDAVAPHGWEVPLGAPAGASVGGALATASIGARRLAQGPPRDCVLGLEVVLGSGERTRCGGRVVKNVTGFDLAKLYTGSFGCLGVIESGWLRLRPASEASAQRLCSLDGVEDPSGLALSGARRASARCCALVDHALAERAGWVEGPGEGRAGVLVAEFAGPGPSVEEDARWLGGECAAREAGSDMVEALDALQGADCAVRARLAVLPSSCRPAASALRDAGAHCVVHPGMGLIYALWDDFGDANAASLALADAARRFEGEARFERLPPVQGEVLDVFGVGRDPLAAVSRMRALKQRFDPVGVLNPGRFLGRL